MMMVMMMMMMMMMMISEFLLISDIIFNLFIFRRSAIEGIKKEANSATMKYIDEIRKNIKNLENATENANPRSKNIADLMR
jgi:hypothetical protein